MPTVITTPDVTEWREIAKYASGKADQISTILEHFEKDLTPELKQWLYSTRSIAREETTVAYQNAIELLKGDQ